MSIKIAARVVLGGGEGRAGKLTRNLGIARFNSGIDDRSSSCSDGRIKETSLYFFIFPARLPMNSQEFVLRKLHRNGLL